MKLSEKSEQKKTLLWRDEVSCLYFWITSKLVRRQYKQSLRGGVGLNHSAYSVVPHQRDDFCFVWEQTHTGISSRGFPVPTHTTKYPRNVDREKKIDYHMEYQWSLIVINNNLLFTSILQNNLRSHEYSGCSVDGHCCTLNLFCQWCIQEVWNLVFTFLSHFFFFFFNAKYNSEFLSHNSVFFSNTQCAGWIVNSKRTNNCPTFLYSYAVTVWSTNNTQYASNSRSIILYRSYETQSKPIFNLKLCLFRQIDFTCRL